MGARLRVSAGCGDLEDNWPVLMACVFRLFLR
jgi:hypothetical protein